jgi:hypothetical protein
MRLHTARRTDVLRVQALSASAILGAPESGDQADEPYIRQITGLTVDRLVVVPGRIVNVVPR